MVQYSGGSAVARAITFGQWARGMSHASLVHAGIMFDNHYMIQALKDGIVGTDIRVDDVQCAYEVYRTVNPNLAAGAANCAKMMLDIHAAHGTLKYSVVGAVTSLVGSSSVKTTTGMDNLLTDILGSKGHPFFCSQFVTYVYQFVAEQNGIAASRLFNAGDAKMSPAALASSMDRNAGYFTHVGFMRAGER